MTKTIKLLGLVLLLAFSAVSCGGEDEPTNSALIGTWVSDFSDVNADIPDGFTLTFRNDGTGSMIVTMSVPGQVLSQEEKFTWSDIREGGKSYIDFVHLDGAELIGTGRYIYTVSGYTLNIFDSTFIRK